MQVKYIIFWSIAILGIMFSCKDDGIDDGGSSDDDSVNEWIETTMRNNYYWYKDIPAANKLNYTATPENFFKSLLSDKDGKNRDASIGHSYYSYMESTTTLRAASTESLSLGFVYQYYLVKTYDKEALKVLYILPGSPAANSDLKRGDWIYKINDQDVNSDLVNSLNNGSNMKLGISEDARPEVTKTVTLKAQQIDDNPVYVNKTINYNGKKIAYLVYNHFTQGPDENNTKDETYNNSLRKAFSSFKSDSPNEFILDLRYNTGGLVTAAQLLATMLAPESAFNNVFCKMTYSDKQTSKNNSLSFDSKIVNKNGAGENMNLKRLFVITSRRTASASEAVINGLQPFLGNNLIIIGEKTEGKNVGSLSFDDDRFPWKLHPIVCLIANKDDFSDYSDGFYPDFECSEPQADLYDLGDTREYILHKVLEHITNNAPIGPERSVAGTNDTDLVLLQSSDRNSSKGMILP